MRKPLSLIASFVRDRRANVAIEFAFIVPLMLTMFFGMVEFSSGIAVNRKVTLAARNMSDLVSQSSTVTDTDLANFTTTAKAIMTPFGSSPSELVAFACGSRSTSKTLSPSARYALTLTAVVVLPTPPF